MNEILISTILCNILVACFCLAMKYIRDDELKVAFVTMISKLVFGNRIILIPYVTSLKEGSKDASLRRIQKIQTLLLENAEQRETLTRLMAQNTVINICGNTKETRKCFQKEILMAVGGDEDEKS